MRPRKPMETPRSYAAHLATYIASPLKIEKLVALEFDHVPPLHEIAELRYRVELQAKAFARSSFVKGKTDNDGEHFAVRSLLPKPKPKPQAGREPGTPWPGWYKPPAPPLGTDVVRSVAYDFGFTVGQLKSGDRSKALVDARAVVSRILRDRGLSYPEIARALGRNDHSTPINSVAKFDIYAKRNPTVMASYERHSATGDGA